MTQELDTAECAALAAAIADPADDDHHQVVAHLAACRPCRRTAGVLGIVRRASTGNPPDLWPRLQARIAAARVQLSFPRFGWEAAAALLAIVTATSLAPEPGRFLAVILGMP